MVRIKRMAVVYPCTDYYEVYNINYIKYISSNKAPIGAYQHQLSKF